MFSKSKRNRYAKDVLFLWMMESSDDSSANGNRESTHGRRVKPRLDRNVPVDVDLGRIGAVDETDSSVDEEGECEWAWSGLEDGSDVEAEKAAAEFEEYEWAECSATADVTKALGLWQNQFNVSLASVRGLLRSLSPFLKGLPTDPRTIAGRTSKPVITKIAGGEFCSLGLISQLLAALARCTPQEDTVYLNLHVDGIPLFKSNKTQLLPILFTMQHANELPPMVISLFVGKEKPPLQEYLKDFAPEVKTLLKDGIIFSGVHYKVKVRSFICDTPARAYIKGVKGHAGYHSCEHCTEKGELLGRGIMVFPKLDAPLRTDASFAARDQPEHHNEYSPLEDTGLGMVSKFPLDYMHLVLLGVVRRLLFMWVKLKRPYRLGADCIQTLNVSLIGARDWWPSDFNRKPRSAEELNYWKATEYRSFILYLSVGVLKQCLITSDYNSYMCLHAAITILCRDDLCSSMLDEAQEYVENFLAAMTTKYGKRIMFINFHNLFHLTACARRYGVLDNFSAFPFENFLKTLQGFVTSTRYPLVSLLNKIISKTNVGFVPGDTLCDPLAEVTDGPVRTTLLRCAENCNVEGAQYRKYRWHGTFLATRQGDNVVYLDNFKVFVIQRIVCSSAGHYLVGRTFRQKVDAYSFPCRSSRLGIFRVSQLAARPFSIKIESVRCKAVMVPYKGRAHEFVVFPLRFKKKTQ